MKRMSSRRSIRVAILSIVAIVSCAVLLLGVPYGFSGTQADASLQTTKDVYYKTGGTPAGPPAPSSDAMVYPRYGSLDNRILLWFVTQQHTYFGGFVLALPIFCLIMEVVGLLSRDGSTAARYDRLARDFLKVALLALSLTAVVGSLMLGVFIGLYPSFMNYMGGTFKAMMPLYALVFCGEAVLLIAYYYSWDALNTPAWKWVHATLGVVANGCGALLLLLVNAWAAFMMSPAGVDEQGRYLGNVWHLLHSALWNPLNVHRFLADLMSGGAVVMAYASYRFLTSKSQEERAYYDWVGYVFLFVTVCALLPMPFAGYWLMRSVYAFRQSMGVTMMGGLLTWLFVVQALLVGVLFLGVNYYLWQSMGRIRGGERYQRHLKYLVYALVACLYVWLTPHTLLVSASEVKAMGGAQHPVIGNYGVMSSKNGAINVMICLTALSYVFYRRANRTIVVPWAAGGNMALGVLFSAGIANIIWLAVYGFYLPASVRVGLSSPQAFTTLTVLIGGLLLNRAMMRGAIIHGPIEWGKISTRGMIALFGLAASFTWVMGLMGYIRSSGRLSWHVSEIMPDVSPWAFTPSLGFAAKMVTLNMVVFWLAVLLLFWISRRDEHHVPLMAPASEHPPNLLRSPSEEAQPS
ncbi:MAG: cytochrome ubiquinol oxidase subunit I [Nitrospiraceae bacterium]